jgi:hypothetical protein
MNMAERVRITESPEAELIRQIENLIRALAHGKASPSDLQRLHELQKRRVEMMRPKKRVAAD